MSRVDGLRVRSFQIMHLYLYQYDKCYREYMESGNDYGERDQNYRKRALEGDADAAFFFARQDAILAGEADARFEAIEMDMSLLE